MKVLILGAAGMLGHKLYQVFNGRAEVYGTVRGQVSDSARYSIFDPNRIFENVDAWSLIGVCDTIETIRPDVVINAIGVIKQKPAAEDIESALYINSIFPHQLSRLSTKYDFRLICISTDCVFRGDRGGYTEADVPDALDLYGQSKHWGEVTDANCLTLRTSIIGHELSSSHSLIDWFWSNIGGKVKGFRRAIYSGFPTITLSGIIADVLEQHTDLSGLYHVSSEPIDKYSLLEMVKVRAGLDIEIEADDDFAIDRSLNSDRFREATGFKPKSWPEMIDEMCSDPTAYNVTGSQAASI